MFPEFVPDGRITAEEIEALLAVGRASADARHELESARSLGNRLHSLMSTAESYGVGMTFQLHEEALFGLFKVSGRYEDAVSVAAWRWTSACTVLGISLLDRIVRGAPALSVATLKQLVKEPTVAELRAALSIPCDQLMVAREADERTRTQETRDKLVSQLNVIVSDISDQLTVPEAVAEAHRVSEVSDPRWDLVHESALPSLFPLAEQLPYEIRQYLKQ
ncbi:hypothetical protein GCM10022245_28330 [Streptomyces mayteni]